LVFTLNDLLLEKLMEKIIAEEIIKLSTIQKRKKASMSKYGIAEVVRLLGVSPHFKASVKINPHCNITR